MTHSEKDAFLFARIAFVEHKKNTLVRRALVRGLSSRENWAVDDCDLAAEIINTGRRAKLEKQFLAKVDFERRRLWSETRNAILRNHPEFAGRDPGLLTAVARLKAEDGDHEGAIEALERLRGSIQQPEHRREILLQMLDLLPHIDPESYEKYIDSLSPDCFEDLELTTALKELCLNRVLPATEAVTIFRRWEDLLRDVWQEGDQSVSGHTVCDDEGRLLDIYLESRDVGGTRSVLRHASNTENPPPGVLVDELIDRVIGLYNNAIEVFKTEPDLLIDKADFCREQLRIDEALKTYATYGAAVRDRTALLEYLKKLIEKIERDAQGLLQAPRLRAYRTLAELHLEFGMLEAAEEDLRRVGEDFFRVEDSGDTHRLAETESFDDPDEVRSLRILFMRILENRFEQGSLDIPALEDLGHLVYSLGHWHLGSRVYHRLIDHYLRQQGAPRHLQRLYHRYFWSHYCRGEAHRGAALEEIHGFVRRHRFDDDLDLTALEEYCALGFHELSLEEDLPGVQANRYRKRADRYYGVIMGRPAAAQRPYLQVLRDGLNRRDDSLSPFDFLKYQYPGVVPYDLPIDRQYFGPIGTDKDVEAEELNIGVGGHGNVHIIKRKVGGVMVPRAIKMLRRDLPDAEFEQVVKDFEQECSIMKDLDHPNIVKFYAAGVDQGRQYIEMEYVRGSDLEVFVHQKGGLIDLAEKLRIFVDVCAGVMYLHCTDRSIVHRDLHPKNVLLGGADAQTVKVADFGLARILDEEGVAKSSRAVGRTFYIPPETTGPSRKPYTIRSDIFSLGRILTFLLTGHPLSDGRALREKVGPALAQVCTDACSSDPEHRPETVAKLLEMLRDATDEDAEVAKRIGDAYTGIERPVSLRELQGRYRPADDQAFPDPSDLASRDFLSIDVADTLDGEEYSLKFISTLRLGGSQIVDRLTRLSQLVAFDHPNIESIVRSGSVKTSSPCFYILYRRIPGLSLMELLGRCFLREQEKGRVLLPVPVAVHVGLETAKALTEAHGQKVVHRMISPSSVSMDLATGRCVLTDFSAAVLKDQENLGRTAVRFGHEDFLAPEAVDAAAGTVSERTDLYSLACTVISTLFGQKRAFVGERDRDLLAERHDLNPEKLHPLLDCLDGARLMRPEDRLYSTAEGFRDALLRASEPLGMDTGSIDWEGIADDFS